jgi:hypothetical protein
MLREYYCPQCNRSRGMQSDEVAECLPPCETCGCPTTFVRGWSERECSAWAWGAHLMPSARECQEAELAHSPLTYRQRCGQRHTDGG